MARKYYTDIDLQFDAELQNAAIQKVTTATRTTLGGSLTATQNIIVFDTDLSKFFGWSGSSWTDLSQAISNPLTLKGEIDASTNPAYPATPAIGDTWIITVAGTVGGQTVEVGDQIIYSTSGWFILQSNLVQATETIPGYVRLATQAEVGAGTNDSAAITPLKLATEINITKPRPKQFTTTVNLVANTPLNIAHNLALSNRDAYQLEAKVLNAPAIFDQASVDVNTITLTSKKTVNNVYVVIHGI